MKRVLSSGLVAVVILGSIAWGPVPDAGYVYAPYTKTEPMIKTVDSDAQQMEHLITFESVIAH